MEADREPIQALRYPVFERSRMNVNPYVDDVMVSRQACLSIERAYAPSEGMPICAGVAVLAVQIAVLVQYGLAAFVL